MDFHHVGIACKSIKDTLEYVQKHFNVKSVSEEIFDEKQNATLCMIEMQDGYRIELITGEVVKGYLKRRQNLYHTCYEVDSIEETLEELKGDCVALSAPKEAILFGGKRVVFLMSPIGLIELLER